MAEQTVASATIVAAPARVLEVVSDFEAYPSWSSAVRRTEVLARDAQGRATEVSFELTAGAVRDSYVLAYDWSSPRGPAWHLVRSEQLLKAMDGAYEVDGPASGPSTVTYRLSLDVRLPVPGMIRRQAEKVVAGTALKELGRRLEPAGPEA